MPVINIDHYLFSNHITVFVLTMARKSSPISAATL